MKRRKNHDNGVTSIGDSAFLEGEKNADCHNVGNGVDAEDALAIQQFKADIVTALPMNS